MSEKQLQSPKKNDKIKLLLLGTGESGKSTFLKQLRIIHSSGFTDQERTLYKKVVRENIVQNMRSLVKACTTVENVPPLSPQNKTKSENFELLIKQRTFSEAAPTITALWKDPAIQHVFQRSSEFQISDNAEYFFNDIDRIAGENYTVEDEDILRVTKRTTGLTEEAFQIKEHNWQVVDVGGHRTERRTWIRGFDDVSAIIFFVSLSEYDKRLEEDNSINRMSESLKLFKDIVNYSTFVKNNTPIILFLNKKDLFEKKIKEVPLKGTFKNFNAPNEYSKACSFIKKEFTKLAPATNLSLHCYKLNSTNTKSVINTMKKVMECLGISSVVSSSTTSSKSSSKSKRKSKDKHVSVPLTIVESTTALIEKGFDDDDD